MSPATGSDTPVRPARTGEDRRSTWVGLDQASVVGLELLVATLMFAGAGWLLDRWLGTEPWFLAIGALVGNATGIYLVWLRSAAMQPVDDARDDGSASLAR